MSSPTSAQRGASGLPAASRTAALILTVLLIFLIPSLGPSSRGSVKASAPNPAATASGDLSWLPLREPAWINCTRDNPGNNPNCDDYHPYWAIDFEADKGDPVYATRPGEVVTVRTGASCDLLDPIDNPGNYVEIAHEDGRLSQYMHLDDVLVEMHQWVGPETQIGTVGNTGDVRSFRDCDFYHLHYAEKLNGLHVEPASMLACNAHVIVEYPAHFGHSWDDIPSHEHQVVSDGTECLPGERDLISASGGAEFLIVRGERREIRSPHAYNDYGLNEDSISPASQEVLDRYPIGPPIYGVGQDADGSHSRNGRFVAGWLAMSATNRAGLGYAIQPVRTDALEATETSGLGGRFQRFDEGALQLRDSDDEAYGVRGGMWHCWSGSECNMWPKAYSGSYLGWPISDEYSWNGGQRQDFEGGYILWTSSSGAKPHGPLCYETSDGPRSFVCLTSDSEPPVDDADPEDLDNPSPDPPETTDTTHAPGAAGTCLGHVVTIWGTDGDDEIRGTNSDDVIHGLDGDDEILGRGGNDIICGGRGEDDIEGGDGNDEIDGGRDDDNIWGDDLYDEEHGDDLLFGADGDDYLIGGPGKDTILGEYGDDYLGGGPGDDTLAGFEGHDELWGEDGEDVLRGQAGDDLIEGGDDDDDISGGDGDDDIEGNDGDDTISGDAGNDQISGQDGADSIDGGDGADDIDAGNGDDYVQGGPGNDSIEGDDGEDTLIGGAGDDDIEGDHGSDEIHGSDGDDAIWGGSGRDTIDGGPGDDRIRGNSGSDVLVGGSGNDEVYGGDHHDSFISGPGNDRYDGESGADLLDFGAVPHLSSGVHVDLARGFALGDGDDSVENMENVVGTPFGDELLGDHRDNRIEGLSGDDTIRGREGSDDLHGGEGADSVRGGAGPDALFGGPGADSLKGNRDSDYIFGGDGDDMIRGGGNSDEVDGGSGDDRIAGGGGSDYLVGSGGDDLLKGSAGTDLIWGGDGVDTIKGGRGNDVLHGGNQDDVIKGNGDDDTLYGDDGDDLLKGGGGFDSADGGPGYDECRAQTTVQCEP